MLLWYSLSTYIYFLIVRKTNLEHSKCMSLLEKSIICNIIWIINRKICLACVTDINFFFIFLLEINCGTPRYLIRGKLVFVSPYPTNIIICIAIKKTAIIYCFTLFNVKKYLQNVEAKYKILIVEQLNRMLVVFKVNQEFLCLLN